MSLGSSSVRTVGRFSGWVDPDFRCRRKRPRNALDEPLWVAGMSGGQHGGPRLEDCRGLASVHDGRCQKPDTPVGVLLVVPVKEPAAEVEAMLMAGEAVWKVGPVLQRLELTF